MKKNILYILSLIALAGCASNDLTDNHREPVVVGDEEIVLTSGVGNVASSNTRAVINKTLPTEGIDVSILRMDKTGTPTPSFVAWNLVPSTNAKVLSAHVDNAGKVKFNDGATPTPTDTHEYYQANGNDTRLQGWYPKSGTLANGVITWTFTGAEDIMVSDYQDGNKDSGHRFGATKKLTFEHLLTQIIVKVYGTNQSALDAWGGIKNIAIKEQNKTCKVTLGDISTGVSDLSVAFSGKSSTSHLDIQKLTTDDKALPKLYDATKGLEYDVTDDKTKADMCGYAMFQPIPAGAANKLILMIETVNGGVITKEISTPTDGGLLAGTAYNVTLKMTSTEIVPEVAITEWKKGADIDVEM